MKVNLAVQAFSNSASAAIMFLSKLKLKEFNDRKPTTEFILMMNNLSDILNSKSKIGKFTKTPIHLHDFIDTEVSIKDYIDFFLTSLKEVSGVPLIKVPRECFVIGFYLERTLRSCHCHFTRLFNQYHMP